MSYTTNGAPQGAPISKTNLIQEAMIGELIAINEYANHIADSNNSEINTTWEHIMEDEKRHYGMLLDLLRRYDSTQMSQYLKVKEHIHAEGGRKYSLYGPQYSSHLILNNLRKDIKGELEAIILYDNNVNQINIREIRDVLYEIISDEKEHVEELTFLLQKYDMHSYGPLNT